MIISQFGKYISVFQVPLFLIGSLTSHLEANENVSQIEKSIYDYYQYVNGSTWKWNVPYHRYYESVLDNEYNECRQLCPTDFKSEYRNVKTENVVLESQDCTQIQMDVLRCICKRPDMEGNKIVSNRSEYTRFVRGVNGEAYAVSKPVNKESDCDDIHSYIIRRCVNNGTEWTFPRNLSEIEELFYNNRETLKLYQKWDSPNTVCESVRPYQYDVLAIYDFGYADVTLESQNCASIRIKVLHCLYETFAWRHEQGWYKFVKGFRGEVYELSYRNYRQTKCIPKDDFDTSLLFLNRRVLMNETERTQLVCPQF